MISDPKQCTHPDHLVSADISEGDAFYDMQDIPDPYPIQWCRVCGAYRLPVDTEWTLPLESLPVETMPTRFGICNNCGNVMARCNCEKPSP